MTKKNNISSGLDLLAGDDSKGRRQTVRRDDWGSHEAAVERGEGPADFPAHFDAACRRFLAVAMNMDADLDPPEEIN